MFACQGITLQGMLELSDQGTMPLIHVGGKICCVWPYHLL